MCLTSALRILSRDIYCEDGVATLCLLDAADEIERLREAIRRLAAQDATLSVCEGNVTVTMDGTLTDEEREAIGEAIRLGDQWGWSETLRGLLRRCPAAENDAKQDNP
jgi:ATP-dependent helicase YprA (DUF1998 family)